MIFHKNCLLADDSHEISYLIFFRKLGKVFKNLLSAAVVIGALRDKIFPDLAYSKTCQAATQKKTKNCFSRLIIA